MRDGETTECFVSQRYDKHQQQRTSNWLVFQNTERCKFHCHLGIIMQSYYMTMTIILHTFQHQTASTYLFILLELNMTSAV